MKSLSASAKVIASNNLLRAQWTYQRLPEGDSMIERGTGMSPAFFSLLRLVSPERAVSFAELEHRLPRLDADDLELWLAELCRMGLIAPAAEVERRAAERSAAAARAPAAERTAAVGNVQTLPVAQMRGLSGIAGSIAAKLPILKEPDPQAFGIDWKRVSLDGLYAELLAICAELQSREQPRARLAA
ncbi:MAG TPA: hypothetical protein VGN52_21590 [Burkholderiales bacterium]|jgi:hypothetical protein